MIPHLSERALLLAPRGRDANVAAAILAEAGLRSVVCPTIDALVAEMAAGAGYALVTEESLSEADLHPLATWLEGQPQWSDFPFILVTRRGGIERNPVAGRLLTVLGNVTFLERPFHPTTLVSLAQAAVRGRRRQYEARARLAELRELTATLEQRVREETAARQDALAKLHQAQKLETIGQLTGGVAHDFNNLLMPITGALDLLQRRYAEADARAARLIDGALQSAERAKTLVQRLLGFARRQSLETQAVDMVALLDGMRDLIASSIGPTIELHTRYDGNLPQALVDPNQLELAILNLCVNARDAMPRGGSLTLVAEEVRPGPSEPELAPANYLRLSVIDTGTGMDEATLARAVEPFFSTKETGRGTGLGLSMVHGLAGQLGGHFAITSTPGKGTRVDLWLPVAGAATVRQRRDAARGRVPIATRPLSILLVDDERLVRDGTAAMLRELGHHVVEAGGAGEALEKLHDGLQVDAVVTDYKMPRMDGAELARRLIRLRPHLPVLLITGYSGHSDDTLGLSRLAKPFRQADIAAALDDLVCAPARVVGAQGI